jgi:hypothetical protein
MPLVGGGSGRGCLSVTMNGVGEAREESASERRLAVDRDHGEVAEDPPELSPFFESGGDRRDVTIRVEHVVGHWLEVVDERQVDLGVSEVWGWVDHHRTSGRTDEVVLLGVTVEQRGQGLGTAQIGQARHQPLHVSRELRR